MTWKQTRAYHWWTGRSLRLRITLVTAVVTVVSLLILARVIAGLIGFMALQGVDRELHRTLAVAVPQVEANETPAPAEGITIRVLDSDGRPVDDLPATDLSATEIRRLKEGSGVSREHDGQPLRRWVGTVTPGKEGEPRLVVVGSDLFGYNQALMWARQWLAIGGLVGGAGVGAATWLLVRWALRPVERIQSAAVALPGGQRLPLPEANDELRRLTEELNALLARRDKANEQLRRFTGDAAHELRSPVASIRIQAEVAVAHPDPEHAQEVLQNIVTEAERLSSLVDNLLALARSDAGEAKPSEEVDLVQAARDAAARLTDGPRVRLEAPPGVIVSATPAEVALVLDNLLRNAARYARALIRVWVLPFGSVVRLIVDDDGPGVPEADRAKVFDRFYRVDDDRGRDTGGTGLGLALVAETVRRRGGTVRVAQSPEGGARFEARWPAVRAR